VGVAELLPSDVSLTTDRTAFLVEVDSVLFQATLDSLCPLCTPLDGQTVPKPAFVGDFTHSVSFPADVEAAVVREGRVVVVARNGFGFDPIRPPGGARGSITMTLRDGGPGGRVLDQETWNGATSSLPPGGTLTATFDVSGPVGSSLHALVTVDSPAGGLDPGSRVLVRLQDQVQVTATTPLLEVISATVRVAGRRFEVGEEALELAELDQEVVDRVVSAALDLEITNPWAVGASLTLTIQGPQVATPVTKAVTLPPGTASAARVEFSQAELRTFLGKEGVTLRGAGTVSPGAGSVVLSPGQLLWLDATLDLTLRIG
jgi:hypothetical protein